MAKSIFTDLDFQNVSRISNLPNGVSAQDPVTMSQMNSALEGLAWKDNARVATNGNINLAAPGASVDGVTMAVNDRVLVKAQTSVPENGIYIWNGAAVPMTRALDASTFTELESAVITIDEGTSADSTFRQTEVNGTIGTNDVIWVTFGASVPTASESVAGIVELADQTETDAGADGTRAVSPQRLNGWVGKKLKFSANIGDGSATSYVVTHNFNTRDVTVAIYRNSGNYDEVLTDVEHTSVNAVTVKFSTAPASDAYRVVVIG